MATSDELDDDLLVNYLCEAEICSYRSLFTIQVLIKMLPSYYQHVCRYESTLVTKFFGVHCVKPAGGVKVIGYCYHLSSLVVLHISQSTNSDSRCCISDPVHCDG